MPFINGSGGTKSINQTKTYSPNSNQQILLPDDGYDAFGQILIESLPLQSKAVTTNGTFTPDDEYLAFGNVIVKASKHACYASNVENETEHTYDGRSTCLFTIPMGNNTTLPSTILIHRKTSDVGEQNGAGFITDPLCQDDSLMAAILEKNDTGYSVRCIGTVSSSAFHLFGVFTVIDIVGTISNENSVQKVSFTPFGKFVTNNINITPKNVSFYTRHGVKFDIISIWN